MPSLSNSKVRAHFKEANDLLRTELGMAHSTLKDDYPYDIRHQSLVNQMLDNPNPLFKWGWSEDSEYLHPMRLLDSDGNKRYDYQCQCGTNVHPDSHNLSCSQAVVAVPAYKIRRILDYPSYRNFNGDQIVNSWVLWRWLPPPDKFDWETEYGTSLSYDRYKSGMWEPCSSMQPGQSGLPVAFCVTYPGNLSLTRGLILNFTANCISAYRRRLSNPAQVELDLAKASEQRIEEQARLIEDKVFTGSGKHLHVPGVKGSDHRFPISFPSVTPSDKLN